MELQFNPMTPWHWVGTLLLLALLVGLFSRGAVDRWAALGRHRRQRIGTIACTVLAASFWVLALWNPRWVEEGGGDRMHIELVLDVSESMRRNSTEWTKLTTRLGDWVKDQGAVLKAEGKGSRNITAGITTVGSGAVSVRRTVKIEDWKDALDRLGAGDFAPGTATELAAGLRAAAERIDGSGGRGAVVLVSDGNDTEALLAPVDEGEAAGERPVVAAARELARVGIPVSVLAAAGARPALSLTSVDVPPVVTSGVETHVRGGIGNETGEEAEARLQVVMNPGIGEDPSPFGSRFETSAEFSLPEEGWVAFRPSLRFSGFGLHVVDVTLETAGPAPERRRFYTYVKRPARLLSVGDQSWLPALADSDLEVLQKRPQDLAANMNFTDIDVVALSGFDPRRLPPGVPEALARANRQSGVGFFFLHGPHQDPEQATVFSGYRDHPLEGLLPIEPKRTNEIPGERHLILMPDTSGSMGGWMPELKTVCVHIINELRPTDKLDIIAFDTRSRQYMQSALMTKANKDKAIQIVEGLRAGGGTDPMEALRLVGEGKYKNGALVFLSDGGFNPNAVVQSVQMRPDLPATVFAFGTSRYDSLKQLATPVSVPKGVNPSKISIPFLGQSTDTGKYWDAEAFSPKGLPFLREDQRLPVPGLATDGALVCSLRDEATFIASRMPYGYPVLATLTDPNGRAGRTASWAAPLSGPWLTAPKGRKAVQAWVESLVGHLERNRYDIEVTDRGGEMSLRVTIAADEGGGVPVVDRLSASVRRADGSVLGVRLDPDPGQRSTFTGTIRLDRQAETEQAFLVLSEIGSGALGGEQRIPFVIAPPVPVQPPGTREDWTHGRDIRLLGQIAAMTGGRLNPDAARPLLGSDSSVIRDVAWWPWLVLLGALFYLGAVAMRRLGRA